MGGRKRSHSPRFRVGKVSGYLHHGAWWLYYREHGQPVRRKVALLRDDAEKLAAQINAQVAAGSSSLLSFSAIDVAELRRQFLDYHELVLKSSLGTVCRYRAATQHLENFVRQQLKPPEAHQVRPAAFATYLRKIEVAPNGHPHTAKRQLRDKGIPFILETCRSMYTFALKHRHLPPYRCRHGQVGRGPPVVRAHHGCHRPSGSNLSEILATPLRHPTAQVGVVQVVVVAEKLTPPSTKASANAAPKKLPSQTRSGRGLPNPRHTDWLASLAEDPRWQLSRAQPEFSARR